MIKLSNPEKLFWADLLLYYEQEVKPKSSGFKIKNKELSEFIKTNSIELNTTNKEELTGLKEETRKTHFVLLAAEMPAPIFYDICVMRSHTVE